MKSADNTFDKHRYAANINGVNVGAAQQRLTSATRQMAVATKGGKRSFAAVSMSDR